MHLGSKNPRHDYKMGYDEKEVSLEVTKMKKYVRVNVNDQLKCDRHVEIQVNKLNKLLDMLKFKRSYFDADSLLTVKISHRTSI